MSTAIAVVKPDPKAEKLPDPESLVIPAAIMLAAETVTDTGSHHVYAHGIYVHAKDRRGRVVATDGNRMFIASFIIEGGKIPSWASHGIVVGGEGLKPRLTMLGKGEQAKLKVTHVKGTHRAMLTDMEGEIAFNRELVDVTYPEYEKVIGAGSFVDLDEEGGVKGLEWKPIGIGSGYLKHCGEVARLLDNGRPKKDREKTGMAVRCFSGSPDQAVVFDFPGWPGAILVVMPLKLSNPRMTKETAALLAPAVKGSIAALRAHSTRWLQVAKAATTDADREAALAKSKEFQARIAALMETAPVPQIARGKQEDEATEAEAPVEEQQPEAPAPAPAAMEEALQPVIPEPEEPAPEEVAPPAGPKVTRRKVKLSKEKAVA